VELFGTEMSLAGTLIVAKARADIDMERAIEASVIMSAEARINSGIEIKRNYDYDRINTLYGDLPRRQ